MKCKQHPYEQGAGMCASCLCERLLALIDAQYDLAAADDNHHRRRRDSDPPSPPTPVLFPRSVSPYRRRSDASLPHRRHHNNRFFNNPQVGPASAAVFGDWRGRFSLFSSLFGIRRGSEADRPDSWLSSLIRRRRRKKKPRPADLYERPAWRDRGMSPEMGDECLASACSSGYLTESSPVWWRKHGRTTPMRWAATAARGGVSGFAVCLSPLVRSSPGEARLRGRAAAEVEFFGEHWPPPSISHHHRRCSGGGAALAPNRSRKLVDLGRFK